MQTLLASDLDIEKSVGKYGLFWINYLKDTNLIMYEKLENDITKPLYKMAREIDKRTYSLIQTLLLGDPIDNIDTLTTEQRLVAQKTKYMQAEEIALHRIIYNK